MYSYLTQLTVKHLINFVGVKYHTLNLWINSGLLLTNEFIDPGSGNARQFNFTHVCYAKIVYEVLKCTNSYEIAKATVEEVDNFINFPLDSLLPDTMYNPITDDGKAEFFMLTNLFLYVIPKKDNRGSLSKPTFYWTYGKQDFGMLPEEIREADRSVILIPVGNIIKKVDDFFREIEKNENNHRKEDKIS